MNREQLEHLIRAAGRIADVDEVLVMGSQAILGQHPGGLPPEVIKSMEADIAVPGDRDGALADRIDGAIGLDSQFHRTFGIYAHGVEVRTAKLPRGWQERLIRVPVSGPDDRAFSGLCLEKHDLCAAKLAARREHDLQFVAALLRAQLVDRDTLVERVKHLQDVGQPVQEAAVRAARVLGSGE